MVVKIGGSIMDDEEALGNILTDIVFMDYVGMRPVLVHGGGKAINAAMEKAGLQPQWVQGRRYTDERTIAIAERRSIAQQCKGKRNPATVMPQLIISLGARAAPPGPAVDLLAPL